MSKAGVVPRWPVIAILAFNGVMGLAAWIAQVSEMPAPLRMLGASLLTLVLPGVAWLGVFRKTNLDFARLVLAVVCLSSVTLLGSFALMAAAVGEPSRSTALACTFIVANVGILVAGKPGPLDPHTPWKQLGLVAACGFLVTSLAGTRLVPPLEDHDMEVRGSAYGLASELKPYFQTNREVYFQMAHPLLFHFHVAGSLIFTDEIGATRPSYESALAAERASTDGEAFPWMDRWWADYRAFLNDPALAGTRAPSSFFAALVLCALADIVRRLTGSATAAVAAALLYASFPETVVRAAYAGYFSVTVFAMMVCVSLFGAGQENQRNGVSGSPGLAWLATANAFAALVNHKTVVLVLGVAAISAWNSLEELLRARRWSPLAVWRTLDQRALALLGGFSAGTFLWWVYGLSVDSPTFIREHLRMHIAHRILLNDLRVTPDPARYAPSMTELWTEFGQHTGYVFLPVALIGIGLWMARRRKLDAPAVMAGWVLVASFLFTITDWRQTKHLMLQLPPMVAAAVTLVGPRRTLPPGKEGVVSPVWLRAGGWGVLVAALAVNIVHDVHLVQDFGSLTISGASDIDGW